MRAVNGSLRPKSSQGQIDYEGHYVVVEYAELLEGGTDVPDGEPTKSVNNGTSEHFSTITKSAVPVSKDGSFFFEIADPTKVLHDVSITVKSPTGSPLLSGKHRYASLNSSRADDAKDDTSAPLVLDVDPFEPIVLAPAPDRRPYRVRGRLLREEDGTPLGDQTLFIHGASGAAAVAEADPVIAGTTTDAEGYFSVEIQTFDLARASVKIAGHSRTYPLSFRSQQPHKLVSPQIIVTRGLDLDAQESDCECDTRPIPPRLPDAEDLAASPAFSDDLGRNCVDVTTPNRALEEFSFFQIVRTTEPEFKKLPYSPPPILRSGPRNLVTGAQMIPAGLSTQGAATEGRRLAAFDRVATKSNEKKGPSVGAVSTATASTSVGTSGNTQSGSTGVATGTTVSEGPTGDDASNDGKEPTLTRDFYDYMQTSMLQHGRWWIFTMDPLAYHGAYIAAVPAPGHYPTYDPILRWQDTLHALFVYLYDDEPKTSVDLFEFLGFIRQQFVKETRRAPSTPNELESFVRTFFQKGSRGRLEVDGSHPIDWDETPTLYQNTTIAHGHILHLKQVWKADGYSLGDLLYSLPLAPCQKKQIAIFDWGRSESAARSEETHADERLQAFLNRDRDVIDVINTSLSESLRGGSSTEVESESKTLGVGFGRGMAASGQEPTTGIVLGVSGGFSAGAGKQVSSGSSNSSAWQTSARDLSGRSLQNLRDSVMQGASAVRNQRTTVVQTVSQGEGMNVQTEVVANHNHCHAVTVEYFEVLRHFAIEQRLVDVQECLFVPLEITPFTLAKTARWRDELRRGVPLAKLRAGFDALEKIRNVYGNGYDPGILANEMVERLQGEVLLSININRPKDNDDEDQTLDESKWSALERLLGGWTLSRVRAELEKKTQLERERVWRQEVLPEIMANFLENIELGYIDAHGQKHSLRFDVTVETDPSASFTRGSRKWSLKRRGLRARLKSYQGGQLLRVYFRLLPGDAAVRRVDINQFYVQNPFALPEGSVVLFKGGYARYATPTLKELLFSVRSDTQDIDHENDFAWIDAPLNPRERFDPVQNAYNDANNLLAHLNQHLEYYHKVIWYQMDPDKRFMMLDGFVAPNSEGRSVASVIENRLLGVVGNNLVMPVARGVRLDPTFRQEGSDSVDLLAHYAPDTPLDPFRVSVPTRGVYAEAVMGACNSCEKVDESRHWRFTEVPCGDEPTQIAAINTDSRRAAPGDLQAKDLPSSIVNIQNAPAAPDTQDLGSALSTLTQTEAFGNITGLEGNQRNLQEAIKLTSSGATEAMKVNVAAAQKYAEVAQALAMHASAVRNADKVIGRVKEEVAAGNLSSEDGKALIKKSLENMAGAPSAPKKNGKDTASEPAEQEADALLKLLNEGLKSLQKGYGKSFQGGLTTPSGSALNLQLESSGETGVAEPMTLSQEGQDFLKGIESLRLQPYDDQTGNTITAWVEGATIGYGHLISQDEWDTYKNGITESEADTLFDSDLKPFVNKVNEVIDVDMTAHEFDALVLLCFNIGGPDFSTSSAAKLINDPNAQTSYASLEDAWKAWNKSQGQVMQGLINRRAAEWKIYNEGVYERW